MWLLRFLDVARGRECRREDCLPHTCPTVATGAHGRRVRIYLRSDRPKKLEHDDPHVADRHSEPPAFSTSVPAREVSA